MQQPHGVWGRRGVAKPCRPPASPAAGGELWAGSPSPGGRLGRLPGSGQAGKALPVSRLPCP